MRAIFSRSSMRKRRGAVAVLAAFLMVVMLGMVAFAVDLGYMYLVRDQAQVAADSAALAAAQCMAADTTQATQLAKDFAGYNKLAGANVPPAAVVVEFGTWDSTSRAFAASQTPGNALRVTVQRDATHAGELPLFFAPVFGKRTFTCSASAVAMTNPRDIAFVVDLSGSMNNDTEPCWASSEIDKEYGPQGYATVATDLMQQVYDDFGYGTFPGTLQYVGYPLVSLTSQYSSYCYAELTKNSGPLTLASIAAAYKIVNTDSESTRKTKAYKWIIDNQIATLMPAARPVPNSANATSLAFWTAYLDYILTPMSITSSSPKGKPRKSYPAAVPANQSGNRIDGMGNPYYDAYASADSNTPLTYRDQIGYRTFVQFMMDFGRDGQPASGQYVPLSQNSPYCPWHAESTDGGTFNFPPREQPTHASRRAIIAAIKVIKDRNQGVSDPNQQDQVAIIAFDTTSGVSIVRSLTTDYDAAMRACASLQAVGDLANSTSTETGLLTARNHIKSIDDGGQGRRYANKVVVMLTDGIPNLHTTADSQINSYIGQNPSSNFYGSSETDKNAALMQCTEMQLQKWFVFSVGIGLGCDYDFMDRTARMGGTADKNGQTSRGTGNPAQYEQRLKDIFTNIITNPKARLVK